MTKPRLTKSIFSLGAEDAALDPDPNRYPDALTEAHALRAAVVCQFLGGTFHDGDKICYQGGVWVCGPAGWTPTGSKC